MQNPEPYMITHDLGTPALLPHCFTLQSGMAFPRVFHQCLLLYKTMIMAVYGQWLLFRAVPFATRLALENYFLINFKANGKQLD